eukprot:TRINITY_DN67964_c0_g1_i1.p1 TRINITY_DN67964_c0_g1~~TRINITY_DN67964_c0_g1_i1.p1  ORF type:complete len:669 (-),score=143.55 TRINITY_DN67964_c0_g1_i1:166-2172(-)
MGQGLPKAVTSSVLKRHVGKSFRVGCAEMNGWRMNMEDANVIYCQETWGFFGVFDGHGGDQCSSYVARRLTEELANGPPKDDAAMRELMLRLDQEFLDTKQASGSTGTFVLVHKPEASAADADGAAETENGDGEDPSGSYVLRVGNIGDSRVLLGRKDGTMVDGPGTDGGLTTDHKPDHPNERARIERTGGHVRRVVGVARVNGDLAVSRAFGDASYKQTGGPAQEDHPVSAEPELLTMTCGPSHFLLLVCDGISEGDFPNRQVVKFAADEMFGDKDRPLDPAIAAHAVCREALRLGSKDNLSCMIVLFGGGENFGPEMEFVPGPFEAPEHEGFRKAYTAMAEHADLNLEQAVEKRYDLIRKDVAEGTPPAEVTAELTSFGEGPPADLAPESAERLKWFKDWLDKQSVQDPRGQLVDAANSIPRGEMFDLLCQQPGLMALAQAEGLVGSGSDSPEQWKRTVRVAPLEQLREAISGNLALTWAAGFAVLAGKTGEVIQDDESDRTTQVRFAEQRVSAWLPTCALTTIEESRSTIENSRCPRTVRVADIEQLRPAMEAIKLRWDARMEKCCGTTGTVTHEDEDGTSSVRFDAPLSCRFWVPTNMLTDVDGDSDNPEVLSPTREVDDGEKESVISEDGGTTKLDASKDGVSKTSDGEDDTELKRQRVDHSA